MYGTFAEVKEVDIKTKQQKKRIAFYLLVVLDGRPARSNFYTTSYISRLVLTATTGHERTKIRKTPKTKISEKEIYLTEVSLFAAAASS